MDIFCTKHKIPLIQKFSDYDVNTTATGDFIDYHYLQLQIFYNIIDQRKSLHVIEKLKTFLYIMKRMKVPKFSTFADSIKVKNNTLTKNIKVHFSTENNNSDDDDNDNDITQGIEGFQKKMKKHPTTFRQRFKTRMKRIEQGMSKKDHENDDDNEIRKSLSNEQISDDNNLSNEQINDDKNSSNEQISDDNNLSNEQINDDKNSDDDKIVSNEKNIDNKINIDREVLKNELNRSALEDLEHLNYKYHKKFFKVITHFQKLEFAHTSFLEKEFFNIIKILGDENSLTLLYEKNIDILNEQIEKDSKLIKDIFSPYFNKIKMRDTPKEESFEDAKKKGTSYKMKETESVREIKVTLQMKDDLKTIIEQDL